MLSDAGLQFEFHINYTLYWADADQIGITRYALACMWFAKLIFGRLNSITQLQSALRRTKEGLLNF
jgi:hypothetical protein